MDTKVLGVRYVLTHIRPHFDEAVAIRLLQVFGESHFQNVSTAPVVVSLDHLGEEFNGWREWSPEQFLQYGVLCVGWKGGMFDEHATAFGERTEGQASCSMVAHFLRVYDNPTWNRIIRIAEYTDQNGYKDILSKLKGIERDVARFSALSQSVRNIHESHPNDHMVALNFAFLAIDAEVEGQRGFYEDAPKALQGARFQSVSVGEASPTIAKVCLVETDFPKVAARAFYDGVDVIIIRRSDKTTQIQTKGGIGLHEVVRSIRIAEAGKRGLFLSGEGADGEYCSTVPGWYYHQAQEQLFNGSVTKPFQDCDQITRLDVEEIWEIVLEGVAVRSKEVSTKQ